MNLEKWQWAWIAGLFEGEGCITFTNDTAKYKGRTVQVKVAMTDRDVIEALDRLIPSPNGVRCYPFPHKKDQWVWMLSSKDAIMDFFEGVEPFLHSRRSERIAAAKVRLAKNRGAKDRRTVCPKGHPLSGDNLYIARTTGARSCLTCRRAYSQARNARQKEERRIARAARTSALAYSLIVAGPEVV